MPPKVNVQKLATPAIRSKKVVLKKKSSTGKYIAVVTILLLLILGAGLGYYFYSKKSSDTPDSTASDSTASGNYASYTVLPGDDISKIANFYYGNGDRTHTLMVADANNLADPYWIYPGDIIKVNNPTRQRTTYTVVAGDTLETVARKVFNDANLSHWVAYQNSNLSEPYTLQAGQILQIFK